MPSPRRFPPPWSIEELNNACFIVRDHDGQRLVYVYFEDEPAADQRRNYWSGTKRDELLSTLRNCRSY